MPPQTLVEDNLPQLVVPPCAVASHPDTITHPGKLRRWLKELPLADPAHLAGQVHRQLQLLIRDPAPGNQFQALLSAYHPLLQSLQQQVWDDITKRAGAHKPNMTLRNHVSQLMLEIACGHMRLINIRIAAAQTPQAHDLLHAALPLARLMQWDILQYNLMRPAVWRQLLHLFAISELYQLSGVGQASELALDFDPNDTHSVFFSALALLLSDPYRLPPKPLRTLVTSLPALASHLRATPSPVGRLTLPISLSGEKPPLAFARQPGKAAQLNHLELDTFLDVLQQQGLAGDDGLLASWLADSLRTLTDDRDLSEARRHPRQERSANYHFVTGLRVVHKRLRDIQAGHHVSDDAQHAGIIVEEDSSDGIGALANTCQQLDHSISGARFRLPAGNPVPDIGDWVLFEADAGSGANAGVGFVGRVRRHLRREDGSHDIGVEKLRGNIIPVGIGISRTPALLNANREHNLLQLIADDGTFCQGSQQTLHGSQTNYKVRYEELLEQSAQQHIRLTLL